MPVRTGHAAASSLSISTRGGRIVRRWRSGVMTPPPASYLAAPVAGFITGATYNIDGGWSA